MMSVLCFRCCCYFSVFSDYKDKLRLINKVFRLIYEKRLIKQNTTRVLQLHQRTIVSIIIFNEPIDSHTKNIIHFSQSWRNVSENMSKNIWKAIFKTERNIQLSKFSMNRWTNWQTDRQDIDTSVAPIFEICSRSNV